MIDRYGPGLILAVIVVVLWRVMLRAHRDASAIDLRHLVLNRHGRIDLLACSFLALLVLNIWVVAVCAIRGLVPDGLAGMLAAVNGPLTTPLAIKVVFGAKAQQPGAEKEA